MIEPSQCALRVDGVQLDFPDFRLGASFTVGQNERVGIVAPSGSGKSTLLRLIAGLEISSKIKGEIWMGAKPLNNVPPENRGVGLVFQNYALFPRMTVLENVVYSLRVKGVPKTARNDSGREWLRKLSLLPKADASIENLSGGERQRVAFARTLIAQPRMLLLDEPFAALDTTLRATSRMLLLSILHENPTPMILVTHDPADLVQLTERCLRYEVQLNGTDLPLHQFSD